MMTPEEIAAHMTDHIDLDSLSPELKNTRRKPARTANVINIESEQWMTELAKEVGEISINPGPIRPSITIVSPYEEPEVPSLLVENLPKPQPKPQVKPQTKLQPPQPKRDPKPLGYRKLDL